MQILVVLLVSPSFPPKVMAETQCDGVSLKDYGSTPSASRTFECCEGDCDFDSDCAGDLICYQRSVSNSAGPPGCVGTPVSDYDYCYSLEEATPTVSPPHDVQECNGVSLKYYENTPSASMTFGCCEGDCDSDVNCAGDLMCFQRSSVNDAGPPGCLGTPVSSHDYCYSLSSHTSPPSAAPTSVSIDPPPLRGGGGGGK